MKKKRTYTVLAIIIAVLALGIGYAAATSTLTVHGNSTITSDFVLDVNFVDTITKSSSATFTSESATVNAIDASIVDELNVNVTFNFNKDNKDLYVVIPVKNNSEELDATVAVGTITQISGGNAGYFNDVTATLYSDSGCSSAFSGTLAKGATAYLKVEQSVKNIPANKVTAQAWSVTLTATGVDTATA